MKPDELKSYRCPSCKSSLLDLDVHERSETDSIETGVIKCGDCSSTYDITLGLARFVPVVNYADSFGFQWNIHARTQLDSYSGLSISGDRVFGVTRWGKDLTGKRILEAGSGAGRFTEVLLGTNADVVSFDYSVAVDANNRNNGSNGKLSLFQGDIFNVPLEMESFDSVICLGVLQHTPDPKVAFASLVRYVRPGGDLIVDVYTRNLAALLQWKYLLRPVTKRIPQQQLYRFVEKVTPMLIPFARALRKFAGRAGARLMPIVEYSHLGLPPELNKQWAILDTFDMYSPAHDHPQSIASVRVWFEEAGFDEIDVRQGPNGVIGKGRKPKNPAG